MATALNHTLFGGRSSWNPKVAYSLAAVIVVAALAWLVFSPTDEERFQAAYDEGRFDEALEIALELARKNPGNAEPLVAVAAAYLQKAYQNQDREASATAAADFAGEAIELDPSSFDGWRALGAAQQILGDTAGMSESYARAAALVPNDPGLLVQIGGAVAVTDPAAASRYYGQALALAPTDPLVNLAVARATFAAGTLDRDDVHLQVALAEGVPTALGAEARVTLSAIELALNHHAKAEAAAREAVELAPGNADAKVALAQALYSSIFTRHLAPDTTLAEVRALAAEALALQPSSALAAFVSFRAATAAGDDAAAAAAATLTRALLPNDPKLSAAAREELSARIDFLQNMEVTVTETSQR